MTRDPGPSRSDEEGAAGERTRVAWDDFFKESPQDDTDPLNHAQEARLMEVRARHEADLMRYPNVVGVSDGVRMTGGIPTGERCIVVFVERKVPRTELDDRDRLPRELEGVPVDVVESGQTVPLGG